jgi:hypothetical protein
MDTAARARTDRGSRSASVQSRPELVMAVVAASAVLAALSDASPTGNTGADIFWNALFGGSLAFAMADARRWSWFLAAAFALLTATGAVGVLFAVIAAGFTVRFAFDERRRRRWMGALVGLAAAQAMIRGRTYGFTGLPTLLAGLACAPAYVSAYLNTSPKVRKRIKGVGLVMGVIVALLTVFTIVSAARARSRVLSAIEFGDQAVAAAERGDQELAAVLIGAAGNDLRFIADDFDQPWLAPGRFVPILGQHSKALRTMADAGANVAGLGAPVLARLDPAILLPGQGRVNLAEVEALVPILGDLFDEVDRANERINGIDLTWIAGPAADRILQLGAELEDLAQPVDNARQLTDILPRMLGDDGPRRYLVVFMTPTESRAAGGFAGNWAEILVDNGTILVGRTGRGDELNDAVPGGSAVLPNPEAAAVYRGFRVDEVFQNLPVVVDFPWVANASAAFYEQATGRAVDAVIGVDAAAMAGVVSLTGPIEVDGRQLGAGALEDFILTGQYIDYEGDEEGRLNALDELTRRPFELLASGTIPSPITLGDVIGPLVANDHLRVVSFDNAEAQALDALDTADAFPISTGQDLLAVITQNTGENKIDTFLQREVLYQVLYDEGTGETQASVTITLTNSAPSSGLPDAIIGNNDQGLPFGTNAMNVEIYSPLGLRGALLDDQLTSVGLDEAFGWSRYGLDVEIPPGETIVVRIDLAGELDVSDGYRLDIEHQPLVNDDLVTLDIRRAGSENIPDIVGWDQSKRTKVRLESDRSVLVQVGG